MEQDTPCPTQIGPSGSPTKGVRDTNSAEATVTAVLEVEDEFFPLTRLVIVSSLSLGIIFSLRCTFNLALPTSSWLFPVQSSVLDASVST